MSNEAQEEKFHKYIGKYKYFLLHEKIVKYFKIMKILLDKKEKIEKN